jgi:hypothetical protein
VKPGEHAALLPDELGHATPLCGEGMPPALYGLAASAASFFTSAAGEIHFHSLN